MERDSIDIRLLEDDPNELIIRYQPVIKLIIGQYIARGCGTRSEFDDMVQETNRKLIERMPRIRKQFNHKSLFRTYFSVVIRNVYLEVIRQTRIVAESRPDVYENTSYETTINGLVIRQEIDRLNRGIHLFKKERASLNLALKYLFGLVIHVDDLRGFANRLQESDEQKWIDIMNAYTGNIRKERFSILGQVYEALGEKTRNSEALRKWWNSRISELIKLMNGSPPKSAYNDETLQILLEKREEYKKTSLDNSITGKKTHLLG